MLGLHSPFPQKMKYICFVCIFGSKSLGLGSACMTFSFAALHQDPPTSKELLLTLCSSCASQILRCAEINHTSVKVTVESSHLPAPVQGKLLQWHLFGN